MKELACKGLKRKTAKLGENKKSIYKERLDFEFNIIEQANIAEYFLIALDIVNYAKVNDVLIEATDSNLAGSLVLYCIGVNHIDPIKHGLMFEKGLNSKSMIVPDISFSLSCDIRDEILNYAEEKYGSYNVVYISKFLSISTKDSIRKVGKTLGFSKDEIDNLNRKECSV